jgi:hypothetical protein
VSIYHPAVVTYTERHVVWVESDDSEDAAATIEVEPWEYTNEGTRVEAWSNVEAPTAWDFQALVYSYDAADVECDAHVYAHRKHLADAKRQECGAAGHPTAVQLRSGLWSCDDCHSYFEREAVAA